MGLVLSAVITYAGINDAIDCLRHLLSGILPDTYTNIEELVQYYSAQLRKAQTTEGDWTTACGQGYLNLTEDTNGHLKTASIKYYHGYAPDTTAILFSTKISSFGDSIEDTPQPNGGSDFRNERYSPAKTKTIVTNSSNSFSINNRNKSPGPDRKTPVESIDRDPGERVTDTETERDEEKTEEKLKWNYTPLNPTPEIQLQSYEDDKPGFFTEDYLRLIIL
ncbi:Ferredoxin--NADP reductase [Operophtera brumata]|uniref:Ferredoxin--NADP reductase n=1 Tax=Operophtera brumata TaxID=104452 RepID=A0A0L7L9Y1_OPEBR|nr:Ferredoxin--NADP reductase [Operophtera brumata]